MEELKIIRDKKIAKWEFLKLDILKELPVEYKIEVNSLQDDTKYFHPVIKIDNKISVVGQGDVETYHIYGWTLEVEQQTKNFTYVIRLDLENFDRVLKVLKNWDKYKEKINEYIEVEKLINENIEILNDIKNNIQNKLLNDRFIEEERKDCLNKLFAVKEWIENDRIIERYGN